MPEFLLRNQMNSFAASGSYRPDIDGLRSIAVLSVFFFHLFPDALPGGYLGVDVFFVISGFLITGILVRENRQDNFRFSHFYARRVKRIFPALFMMLLASSLVALVVFTPETYTNFMRSGRYSSAQISNFLFAREVGYFSEGFSGQPLLHTWSLGVEEQFYLVWPLLIYLFFKLTRLPVKPLEETGGASPGNRIDRRAAFFLICIALLSAGACHYLAGRHQRLAFYMFYARAFEFCIGGILSLEVIPRPRSGKVNMLIGAVGIVLLLASFLWIGEEIFGESFLRFGVIVPCIGAALLIHADCRKHSVNTLLAMKVPVFIGMISYSLYLYHWPIIVFWKSFANVREITWLSAAGILSAAFILAAISYFLVEQPARTTGKPDRFVLAAAILAVICCATTFRQLQKTGNAAWRVKEYHVRQADFSPYDGSPKCTPTSQDGIDTFRCATGGERAPVIALLGDSHALHYLYGVTEWAAQNGYDVKYASLPGCPILAGGVRVRSRISTEDARKCNRILSQFDTLIVNDPDVVQVLIAQRFDLVYSGGAGYRSKTRLVTFEDPDGNTVSDHLGYYREKLAATVEELKEHGKGVALLKQIPILNKVKECRWEPLLKRWLSRRQDCAYEVGFLEKWQLPSAGFVDEFARGHRVEVFDPTPFFATPMHDGDLLYSNEDHLNGFGIKYLTPFFMKGLDRLVAGSLKQR